MINRALAVLDNPRYRYRPRQLLLRIARAVRPPASPIQEVVLPWGVPIRIQTNEHIGSDVWRTGLYDIAVSEAIFRLMAPGDTGLDVGANIGHMTGIMAVCGGESGSVYAFEPHPGVRAKLEHNLSLAAKTGKPLARVHVMPDAVSDEKGEATLVSDDEFAHNEGTSFLQGTSFANKPDTTTTTKFTVQTARLDDVLPQGATVSVMKIDVEGHELPALRGAERLLKNHAIRHIIYEDHNGTESDVHKLFQAHGYTLFSVGWERDGPRIGSYDKPLHKDYEPANYLASADPDGAMDAFAPRGWKVYNRLSAAK